MGVVTRGVITDAHSFGHDSAAGPAASHPSTPAHTTDSRAGELESGIPGEEAKLGGGGSAIEREDMTRRLLDEVESRRT